MDLEALELPWRLWTRQRDDWKWIACKSVLAIELSDYDPNAKQMRTDIVVTRADGMSVRLHPHKHNLRNTTRSEVIYIEGKLRDWLGEDDLAIFLA